MHIALHRGIQNDQFISKITLDQWRDAVAQVDGLRLTNVSRWRNPRTGEIRETESPGYAEMQLDASSPPVTCYPSMGAVIIEQLTDPDHPLVQQLARLLRAEVHPYFDDEDDDLFTVRVIFPTPQSWAQCLALESTIEELLKGKSLGELVGIGTEASAPCESDFARSLEQLRRSAERGYQILDLSFETDDIEAIIALLRDEFFAASKAIPAGSRCYLLTDDGQYELQFSKS